MSQVINCACVIHGDAYDWQYVERLYNMLKRNLTGEIKLHVYTEAHRPVPSHMIKHSLMDWGIQGPKKSWWYKMQLFDSQHFAGQLLYFDLDVVIVNNIDWIANLPVRFFWTLKDFKYMWRPTNHGINSSVMFWDTVRYQNIWDDFVAQDLSKIMKKHRGDQDYIGENIDSNHIRFLDQSRVLSWRWQCFQGGFDFKRRIYLSPQTPTKIPPETSVLIFHGKPKPAEVDDPVIVQHWR